MALLQADVHVAPETLAQPIRAGDHPFNWSPIASTLIRGKALCSASRHSHHDRAKFPTRRLGR